jgi:hypothetical protein
MSTTETHWIKAKVMDSWGFTTGNATGWSLLTIVYGYNDGEFEEGHHIQFVGPDIDHATDAIVKNEETGNVVARFKVIEDMR